MLHGQVHGVVIICTEHMLSAVIVWWSYENLVATKTHEVELKTYN